MGLPLALALDMHTCLTKKKMNGLQHISQEGCSALDTYCYMSALTLSNPCSVLKT